jgi:hypothetical protein
MDQLKRSRSTAVKVCLKAASQIVDPAEISCLPGETLSHRAARLDSQLEKSRADIGARGEPAYIEISGLGISKPNPKWSRVLPHRAGLQH